MQQRGSSILLHGSGGGGSSWRTEREEHKNAQVLLPPKESIEREIRRHRANNNQHPVVPTDRTFSIPENFQDLVLYDSGQEDPNRIIALGDEEMVRELEGRGTWLGDGTFKISPTIYSQVWVLHKKVGNSYPAVLYFLLPNKEYNTYSRMVQIIQDFYL